MHPSGEEDLKKFKKLAEAHKKRVEELYPEFYMKLHTEAEQYLEPGIEDPQELKARLFVLSRTVGLLMGRIEAAAHGVLGVPEEALKLESKTWIEEGQKEPLLRFKSG